MAAPRLRIFGTGLLSLGPKVYFDEGVLVARTNLLLQILCLFFWRRKVTVDPTARSITIKRRYLWVFFLKTEYGFDEVSHIA